MSAEQPNNPLHGITLQAIVEDLVERHGWYDLAGLVPIRCFTHDPSVRSSLKFLRKTPWARAQVEQLYLKDQEVLERKRKRNRRRAAQRAFRAASEPPATEPTAGAEPEAAPVQESGDESGGP